MNFCKPTSFNPCYLNDRFWSTFLFVLFMYLHVSMSFDDFIDCFACICVINLLPEKKLCVPKEVWQNKYGKNIQRKSTHYSLLNSYLLLVFSLITLIFWLSLVT